MKNEMTKRQKEAIETRRRIVEAADKLMRQNDFAKVTVGDIAKEAGTATGTFYVYFKHKEDVVEELNKTNFLRLAETTNAMTDSGLLERLAFYSREFLAAIERCGVEVCRQWIRNNVAPTRANYLDEDITKYNYDFRAMRSILLKAIEDGLLKKYAPVDELALLVNSQLYGLMLVWCMSGEDVVGSKETDSYVDLFLKPTLQPYLRNNKLKAL